ncbi:hypothetical protein HHK36_007834 [Tetracentron sinense]|uniref:Protein kinase domain-containing protein n=1 Tax=Tetracentron sinense TaxID=13715 RepID=A0A834ZP10_TETSI|nr:hypothetical protein HHK36_007834 [Tetracentron sinense]
MDREANLLAPPATTRNLPETHPSRPLTSSSSSSSSPPRSHLRDVQAVFKRHRPLGMMQSTSIRPRRMLVSQREPSTSSFRDVVSSGQLDAQKKCILSSFCCNTFAISFCGSVCAGADERMANLSSHMSSLALTEMKCDATDRVGISTDNDHDPKQRDFQNTETSDISLRSDGGISSLLPKRSALVQDQRHQFTKFLQSDVSHPMTQSSVVGSTCPTTISNMEIEHMEEFNVNPQPVNQRDQVHLPNPSSQCTSGTLADQTALPTQASVAALETPMEVKDYGLSKEQQGCVLKGSVKLGDGHVDHPKNSTQIDGKSTKERGFSGDVTDAQSQAPLTKNSSSNTQLELSKSGKPEKAVSAKGASVPRRKNYDPELFFKVNGKLYQKLGKIGSGGSSEVHKVISSDCTIYALKKIKLKGRDYSTAYGFSQEIEYLNKLKGKNNIIQLIDYEVTDKTLLQEVMNGSMNIKDGRIKDDGYIYMVLEYGEIDLAHMLSQKWKGIDSSNWTIDENWLRFYWQQILQAVNTIHEERIVHSDLKPANFLLVKGSLKLIDFGIAKAIMSDTTNIQRDSQVGTLSYMSPEAFMCNENDANGNTIKCGRPSDIWSLGCILYQMVYGKTPFADYKTFWAKFKVITDQNHEITYGPVSNPWLVDLMKKCLAWERKERWRIPQLLQHPFIVPPMPSQLSSQHQSCKLLQLMAEAYGNDREASMLCSQLQQLLTDHIPPSTSRDQHCKLLSQMSSLCFKLQQHLGNLGEVKDPSM